MIFVVPAAADEIVDPMAVIAEMDRFAQLDLWPGFDPREQPIAIFDGDQTLLLRHPSPPQGFSRKDGEGPIWRYEGRHPAMRWNSTADIGGVRTATLLLTIEPGRAVEVEASILLHESFHVWSRPRHTSWRPNEMHRYSYPMTSLENYRLLLIEEEALARSLESEDEADAASWAAAAFAVREERRQNLKPEHLEFETALEMLEGTAVFLARTVLGEERQTERLRKSLPPDGIRWRCYEAGAAIAAVLERHDPGWKDALEAEKDLTFSSLLSRALSSVDVTPAEWADGELESISNRAKVAIKELEDRRSEFEEDFASRPHRVVVEIAPQAEPFAVESFNPVGLEIVSNGQAIHLNRIKLKHVSGMVEFRNPDYVRGSHEGVLALTVPDGDHPLQEGIRKAAFAGYSDAPMVRSEQGQVTVEAPGLMMLLDDARVDASEGEVVVRVGAIER